MCDHSFLREALQYTLAEHLSIFKHIFTHAASQIYKKFFSMKSFFVALKLKSILKKVTLKKHYIDLFSNKAELKVLYLTPTFTRGPSQAPASLYMHRSQLYT